MKRTERIGNVYIEKVPVHQKYCLTLDEAALCFNIGINKIREISDEPGCDFVLFIGTKRLIKKWKFIEYLSDKSVL